MIDREKIKADINLLIAQNNRLLTQIKSKAKAIQTKDSDLEIFIRDNVVNKKDNKIINVATVTPEEANSTLKDMRILNKKIQDNVITIKMLTNKLTEKILSKKEAEYVRANIMATIYGQLSMTIQGRTVTNILGDNGDFETDSNSDGVADGWSIINSTAVALDSTNKMFGNKSQKTTSKNDGTSTVSNYTHHPFNFNVNDKIYVTMHVKYSTLDFNPSLRMLLRDGPAGTVLSSLVTIKASNTNFSKYSAILTATDNTGSSAGLLVYDSHDPTTTAFDRWLDGVLIVNLTKTFGAGNEPLLDECDKIFSFINGTKSVSPDLAIVGTNKNLLYSEFREGYYTDFDTMTSTTSEVYVSTYPIHIKAGTYTFSSANPIRMVRMYDSLGESYTTGVDFPATITIPYDCEIVMSFRRAESPNTIWNLGDSTSEASIQLEEGSMVTEYIRHDKNVVYFSDIGELRSVGDVYDEINVTEGKYIQRIGVDETDPGDPTFSRSSVAYLSDGTQVAANVPRFETGKFGQAVMVEEGTTNIFPHSKSFEECSGTHIGDPSNSNGVTTDVGGGWKLATHYNSATIKISEDGGLFGSKRLSFIHDGSSDWKGAFSSAWSIVAGKTYTVTVWARANQASTKSFKRGYAFYPDSGQQYFSFSWPDGYPTDAKNAGKWVRGICTFTATANESGRVYLYGLTDGEAGLIIDYDGLQVEEKPYDTSFIDGTRSPETLTIPTAGVLNKDEGTIELWINPITVQNWNRFFYMGISTGRFLLLFTSTGIVSWDYGPINFGLSTGTGVAVAGQWLHVAMRWSASKGSRELFVNGQYIGTKSFIPPDSLPATVSIVNNYGALIDDLRISSHARTDQDIAYAYNSGAPLPVDEYTSYKLGFDDNLNKERAPSLIYQLETPIISDVDPAIIVDMVNRYTLSYHSRLKNYSSNITFDYPLETIDRVEDIDNKEIDLSKVHLAADGLSVTIDDAMPGDEFRIYGPYKQGYFVEPTLQIVT